MTNTQFIQICKQYDIEINIYQYDKLYTYYKHLIEENNKYNLTTITNEDDVFIKHFLDSMIGAKYLQSNSKILDIGCGAGFPSIPLNIITDNNYLLIDSVGKKVDFVNNTIELLGLNNINAIHTRCEDIAINPKYREKYDIVISRAVASINILIEYCIPFLKVGGKCIMYKGLNYKEEITNTTNALKELKCKIINTDEIYIKELNTTRSFVIIEKLEKTPKKYPRLQNKARKQPL